MITPRTGVRWEYELEGKKYTMRLIDHSMFVGPCTVEIAVDGDKFFMEAPYNDLLRFLNLDALAIKTLPDIGEE